MTSYGLHLIRTYGNGDPVHGGKDLQRRRPLRPGKSFLVRETKRVREKERK